MPDTNQLSFNLDFRPAYSREDYFVGESNQEAIHSIDNWDKWGPSPFVIIYGGEGSGKKHIAAVWQTRSSAVVMDARSFGDTPLEDILRDRPNIILHQLHLILGDRELEEKLFHIYNSYIGQSDKRFVLMTSRKSPGQLEFIIPDLKSRMLGSPNIGISNLDDTLLAQVLGKQLHDKGFQPTADLLRYSINLMERSWAAPKRLAETLNKMSLDKQKGLTKKMIREAIGKMEEGGGEAQPEIYSPSPASLDRKPS